MAKRKKIILKVSNLPLLERKLAYARQLGLKEDSGYMLDLKKQIADMKKLYNEFNFDSDEKK